MKIIKAIIYQLKGEGLKIGIIVAMKKELDLVMSLFSKMTERKINGNLFYEGKTLGGLDILLHQTGVGKVNATIGAVEMINSYLPDQIISTGVAGGATTLIPTLHIVAGSKIVYHDVYCGNGNAYGQVQELPQMYSADDRLLKIIKNLESIHIGLIASGDWFVDTKRKAGEILDNFPEAIAFDMESGALAQTCFLYGIPFLSLRVISDIPLASNHEKQYADFWEKATDANFTVLRTLLEKIEENIRQ